jgi:hypothetical protein
MLGQMGAFLELSIMTAPVRLRIKMLPQAKTHC